jgi:hypothetical protein
MNLRSLGGESLKARKFQGGMACQCPRIAGIKHGDPHELVSRQHIVVHRDHVMSPRTPSLSFNLVAREIRTQSGTSKLIPMQDPVLISSYSCERISEVRHDIHGADC